MFPQAPSRPPMSMPSRPPMPGMGGGMPPGMMGGGMPPGISGGMPPEIGGSSGNPDEAKVRELASMLERLLQQLYQQFPFLNG